MNIVVYNVTSGEIRRSATCVEQMLDLQYDNKTESYLEHGPVDDSSFYIFDGGLKQRPEFDVVISGTVISGLPNPTTVITVGTVVVVTDGQADLTFSQSGTYAVQLQSFPYVDKVVEVTQL